VSWCPTSFGVRLSGEAADLRRAIGVEGAK
jgi:hypothetical protein